MKNKQPSLLDILYRLTKSFRGDDVDYIVKRDPKPVRGLIYKK